MATGHPSPETQSQSKKKLNSGGFINSPYLLLLAPLLIGGFYLVLNPHYITLALNYPYSAAFILAIPVCVFAVRFVFTFFSVIEKWIRLQFERARSANRGQFLEFVIAVFMFVSICEAGPFFNEVQGHILWGALGYITVFAFDLVAVVCMRSRAKMLRKGHDKKGFVYEIGVWLCALASVYANLRSALVNLAAANNGTDWLSALAPLVGVAFPVMIIFLSYATDADEDVDDPDVYKRDQGKRVAFLRAKREIAAQVLEEKIHLSMLQQREFFWKSWLFPKKKMQVVIEVVTKQVKAALDPEITTLKQELLLKDKQITDLVKRCDEIQQIAQEKHFELERHIRQFLDQNGQDIADQLKAYYEPQIAELQVQLEELKMQQRVNMEVSAVEDKVVYNQAPSEVHLLPRVTSPLRKEEVNAGERETGNNSGATSVNKPETKVVTNTPRGDASKRVLKILKKYPDIAPTELAKKANVSRPYASRLRSQLLAQQQ